MNAPIRVRLTAWYIGVLALILAIVATFLVVSLRADLTSATDRNLRQAVRQLATGYRTEGPLEFREVAQAVLLGERPAAQVLGRSGTVVAEYGDVVARTPMMSSHVLSQAIAGAKPITTAHLNGSDFRVIATSVKRGGHTDVVAAGVSLAPVDRAGRRVLMLLLIALPAALLATAAGGWWLARRALRPVERMTTAAELIGVGRLRQRIAAPAGRDEIAHLAKTLNSMLDRIEHAVGEQQRLVADASHELRTPLAVMRSEIDVSLRADRLSQAARQVFASVREEVDRLSTTVEDLLTLAASDAQPLSQTEELDLRSEAQAVVEALRPLAELRRISIGIEGDPAVVRGDGDRLRHAVRNLVENAVKFSDDGGAVTVRSWTSSGRAGVTVDDHGPGVPEALRERVFDRFFRVDPSRTRKTGGAGLGLAIVKEIATAHGGDVHVRPLAPRGSSFEISLPAR